MGSPALTVLGDPLPLLGPPELRGTWVFLTADIPAFVAYRRHGELSLWRWLRSFRGLKMCAEFARDDLAPFFFTLKLLAVALLQRVKQHL